MQGSARAGRTWRPGIRRKAAEAAGMALSPLEAKEKAALAAEARGLLATIAPKAAAAVRFA